jgi:hypothetical protein
MRKDIYIFCQSYYYNHILHKEKLGSKVDGYSKILGWKVNNVESKRLYYRNKEDFLKQYEEDIEYCQMKSGVN